MDEHDSPDEVKNLRAELDEARDDYARSEEDGWFYPDEED